MFKIIFYYQIGETKHSDYFNKDDEQWEWGEFANFLILNEEGFKR